VSLDLDNVNGHLDLHFLVLYPDFNILVHYNVSPV